MSTAQETARQALQWLARDGWCKGSTGLTPERKQMMLSHPDGWGHDAGQWRIGSHCAGGAVNLALSGGKSSWWSHADEAYAPFAEVIRRRWPEMTRRVHPRQASPHMSLLMVFNDDMETSYDDVIAMLREVEAS